ncbi:MAG TPA: TonB-dependent receptor [Caulobacteraceae bacterium]|jgi:iron complex outermembrane receptor protein|nr:TonB-dependent receptor [Caulobacteraceae bacterium]
MGFENGFATRAAHGASLLVLAATLTVAGTASAQTQAAATAAQTQAPAPAAQTPAATPPAAQTQAGAPTGQTQDAAPAALEEIVVTAEHVTENAQTTPITMSVYSNKSLKALDVTSINSLSTIAPDLNFSVAEGEPVLTVRGISSRDVTENGDPAVTVDTDGFYLNRSYALDATLYDLDRVELLRGPQGTLNGRNSVGGSLNVVTAKPTDQFGAYTSLEYGSYNELNFQGMVNIPISDKVQVRAAFLSENHDGYRNNAPGPNADDADNKSGRVEVAFEPTNNFHGLLTFQHTSEGGAGDAVENIPFEYTSTGALNHNMPAGVNASTFPNYTPESLNLSENTFRYNFVYDLDKVEFTFLGGYDQMQWHHATDQSNPWSDPSVYQFQQNEYPDTVNAEFRVASRGDGRLQWQAGVFFFAEDSHLHSQDAAPLSSGGYNDYFGFVYSTRSRSEAAYLQASYQITDKLKLTGGVRYTHDSKEESGYYGDLSTNVIYANQTGSESSSQPTYHVGLDYQLTRANMLYAKFDTGYKAGGFNFGAGDYAPETVKAFEIGSKNRFLDNSLEVNLSAFYDDYTNQQVSTYLYLEPGLPSALTENAGSSTIYGVESQVVYNIPLIGRLDASVDYLHARYNYFLSVADPSDPSVSGNVQLAGNTPPQSPTWTFEVGLEHTWEVFNGSVTGRIQTKAETASNFSFYDYADTEQKGYTMSDAYVSYAPGGGHWKLTIFAKNLENSAVFSNAEENLYARSYTYGFEPPRTYGTRIEYTW